MTKKEKLNVYEHVQEKCLEAIRKGCVPWQMPWSKDFGAHFNLLTGKEYRGVNQVLCGLSAMVNGYSSPCWLTFKQAAAMAKPITEDNGRPVMVLGDDGKPTDVQQTNEDGKPLFFGGVRKYEKSTVITFWKPIEVKDATAPGGKKKIALLKHYRVFNAEQIDGIEHKLPKKGEHVEFNPIERAQEIINGMPNPPEIKHGGDGACYMRDLDRVQLPNPESFDAPEYYYWAAYHELAHATGSKERLNREKGATFGDDKYGKEELVAQFASMFLSSVAGLDQVTFDNSAAYLDHWAKAISADEKLIIQAAGAAQRAADYILGTTFEDDEVKES